MKVAGIQISAGPELERNIQRALDMAEAAVDKNARIICYPELFLTSWFPHHQEASYFSFAQTTTGEVLKQFEAFSKKTQTILIIPFFESAKQKYYNSAALFDSGKLAGVYRKVHLPDIPLYREKYYFAPGDSGFPVFETSQGKIGVQICWDNLFPEGSRILALKGADMIFAPTAASLSTHVLWERAICANAFANNVFVFRVNRVGQDEGISFYGRSFCVNPWGEMASELAGGKDAIVIADIDQTERDAASKTWGFLNHRRPDEYGELLK
ncbi:MAG: nitrilase-related carbon-nitrogen hydrolase [Nitrospirota bacterium]